MNFRESSGRRLSFSARWETGYEAIILSGVTVGDGAIIGARAVRRFSC